jgi:hypothetical protein
MESVLEPINLISCSKKSLLKIKIKITTITPVILFKKIPKKKRTKGKKYLSHQPQPQKKMNNFYPKIDIRIIFLDKIKLFVTEKLRREEEI